MWGPGFSWEPQAQRYGNAPLQKYKKLDFQSSVPKISKLRFFKNKSSARTQ